MNEIYTMQTTPCECKSFSTGFATGAGIVAGVAVTGAALAALYYLLKKR